jgi:hypothetical protein
VRKNSPSPEQVTYEPLPPSSDLEKSAAYSINQAAPTAPFGVSLASHPVFSVSLTIERTKDASAVYIRENVGKDDKRYQPQTAVAITLKGGRNLFPSFDIPALPAIGAYTDASVSRGAQYAWRRSLQRGVPGSVMLRRKLIDDASGRKGVGQAPMRAPVRMACAMIGSIRRRR